MRTTLWALGLVLALTSAGSAGERAGASAIIYDLTNHNLSAEEILGSDFDVTALRVLNTGKIPADLQDELKETLDKTEDGYAEIRSAIARHAELSHRLGEAGVDIQDVVAATRSDAGDVTIYVEGEVPSGGSDG